MRCANSQSSGRLALGLLCGWLLLGDSVVRAQVCDEDAGSLMCDEDAGWPDEDAGIDEGGGGQSGSMSEAGSGGRGGFDAGVEPDPPQCSCTADFESGEQGRIHVCTEGKSEQACAQFSCQRGRRSADGCDSDGVELCCMFGDDDLVSVLYDDCSHPNCAAGFHAQCADFGGVVLSGSCRALIESNDGDDDDDDGGGCAVTGASRTGDLASVLLALWWLRRRRSSAV